VNNVLTKAERSERLIHHMKVSLDQIKWLTPEDFGCTASEAGARIEKEREQVREEYGAALLEIWTGIASGVCYQYAPLNP
jgi:hypothetical protein